MKVLVTAASRHGSTAGIAEAIASSLAAEGFEVTVAQPDDVNDVRNVDAVVLGSAVYAGHWLEPASDLVDRLGARLCLRPVWLFSSGPVGDPPKPDEEAVDVAGILEFTRARGHRVFAGNIDRAALSFPERAIVRALGVPVGDYRDWDEIARWSKEIAEELRRATA